MRTLQIFHLLVRAEADHMIERGQRDRTFCSIGGDDNLESAGFNLIECSKLLLERDIRMDRLHNETQSTLQRIKSFGQLFNVRHATHKNQRRTPIRCDLPNDLNG